MTPGAFMPLYKDRGPGNLVVECLPKIPMRVPQLPTAPINMIRTVITPSKEEMIPTLAITRA